MLIQFEEVAMFENRLFFHSNPGFGAHIPHKLREFGMFFRGETGYNTVILLASTHRPPWKTAELKVSEGIEDFNWKKMTQNVCHLKKGPLQQKNMLSSFTIRFLSG